MTIIVNMNAGGGRAARRWATVRRRLDLSGMTGTAFMGRSVPELLQIASLRRARGERVFVAAGGDGTVNSLVTSLLASAPEKATAGQGPARCVTVRSPLHDLCVGAIGLGSSNDFHKPRGEKRTISGIPVAIDTSRATPRDAVAVRVTVGGRSETRWLLLNGGVGFTADANVRFNDGGLPGRLLRRLSTSAAILAAIAETLARLRDTELSVSLPNEQPRRVSVTNLTVLVSPCVSGSLAFPSSWTAPGAMGMVLLSRATRRHLLRFLAGLLRGRCTDSDRCSHRLTTSLTVAADTPVPLEIDGEIVRGERFEFTLHPSILRVCT